MAAFKAALFFLYTDQLPQMPASVEKNSSKEKTSIDPHVFHYNILELLMIADRYGLKTLQDAVSHKLSAGTSKPKDLKLVVLFTSLLLLFHKKQN